MDRQSAENWEMILDEEFKTLHGFIDSIKEKLAVYPPLEQYKYLQPMREMIVAAWQQLREHKEARIEEGGNVIKQIFKQP